MNENILDDGNLDFEPQLVRASKGKRLVNYLIDSIVYSVLLVGFFLLTGLLEEDSILTQVPLLDNIVTSIMLAFLYALTESNLKGKTIGKHLTRTRVVNFEGRQPDNDTIMLRSLARVVPFEPLSYLGESDGWHDRWTNTMVIDEDLSVLPNDQFI